MTLEDVEAVLGQAPVRHDDWGPRTILLYTEVGLKIALDETASQVDYVEIVDGSAVVEQTRLTGSYSVVRDALAELGYAAHVEVSGVNVGTEFAGQGFDLVMADASQLQADPNYNNSPIIRSPIRAIVDSSGNIPASGVNLAVGYWESGGEADGAIPVSGQASLALF